MRNSQEIVSRVVEEQGGGREEQRPGDGRREELGLVLAHHLEAVAEV